MRVVLDANIIFEIIFQREKRDYYLNIINNSDEILAPDLFIAESTNVMWQYAKAGYVDEENAKLSLVYALKFVEKYAYTGDYSIEAMHEALRLNHPVYDMYYFVLARDNAASLLTLDEKLAKLCRDNGVSVV